MKTFSSYLFIVLCISQIFLNLGLGLELSGGSTSKVDWRLSLSNMRLSGKIIWNKSYWNEPCTGSWDWPLVIDPDGDSLYYIFKYERQELYGFTHNGDQILNISCETVNGSYLGGIPTYALPYGDFDGDKDDEIAFVTYLYFGYIDLRGMRLEKFIRFNNSGVYGSLIYGDFDGDGKNEFIISKADIENGGLYKIDPQTLRVEEILNTYQDNQTGTSVPIGGEYLVPIDIDGDGVLEIAFCRQMYMNRTVIAGVVDRLRSVLWYRTINSRTGGPILATMYAGDFDDDSICELVVITQYGEVYIFDSRSGDLKRYFAFPLPSNVGYFTTSIGVAAFVDIDLDGNIEGIFIWKFTQNDPLKGILAIVDMKDYVVNQVLNLYIYPGYWVDSVDPFFLILSDINLDGYYDIILFLARSLDKYPWVSGNITIIDGKSLSIALSYDLVELLPKTYYGSWWAYTGNLAVIFDVNNDCFLELVLADWEISIFVMRLIFEPYVLPLMYWNPPWGYYNTFGNYELFDHDHDGLADWIEKEYGLSTNTSDTDGDGVSDKEEILEYLRNYSMLYWKATTENFSINFSLMIIISSLVVGVAIIIYIRNTIKKKRVRTKTNDL